MPDVNVLAVIVATLTTFVLGGVFYAVLGNQLAAADDGASSERSGWQLVAVELARGLFLSAVVAGLATQGDIGTATGGLVLGLALWVGFPVVLWSGAMFHERVPLRPAAIHAGDWLVKLLVVGVLVSVWQ